MMLARAYLETPARRLARWGGSAGMIVALHVTAGVLALLFWPGTPPRDEQLPGAILMELESLAAESPSEQQDLAEQPQFDTSAPPPSPTDVPQEVPPDAAAAQPAPEQAAEVPVPQEPVPETRPVETPPVEEAPLAPEPDVTLPKEVPPKETPVEEKPVEKTEAKKEEPVKKPMEAKAEKTREAKAAQKSESKEKRQAAASAKGRFDPNPIYRAKPAYPSGARASKIEGYVVVRYSVSASGAVTSVSVVSASPPGIFNSATVAAVRQWRFKPSPQGGSRTTTVRFKLR